MILLNWGGGLKIDVPAIVSALWVRTEFSAVMPMCYQKIPIIFFFKKESPKYIIGKWPQPL